MSIHGAALPPPPSDRARSQPLDPDRPLTLPASPAMLLRDADWATVALTQGARRQPDCSRFYEDMAVDQAAKPSLGKRNSIWMRQDGL